MDDVCPDYLILCLNRGATPGTPGVIVAPIVRTLSAASCRDSLHTSLGNNNTTGVGERDDSSLKGTCIRAPSGVTTPTLGCLFLV